MRGISLASISFCFLIFSSLLSSSETQGRADSGGNGKSKRAGKKWREKKVKRGFLPGSLLFFAPFFFSTCLDFPYPHYLPLGLRGWVTLGARFFLTRHAILKPETVQKIEVSHKRNLWPERVMAVYALRLGH